MNEVVRTAKTSAQAICSLVFGILSFLCFGFLTGIPAVICGHVARSNIRKSQGALAGSGMALAGLILGYIGIVVTTLGILAAIAIPNFMAYREKAFCSKVESEANHTVAAIADYFSDPNNTGLPTLNELADVTGYSPTENVTIDISGTEYDPVITVFDNSERCPRGKYFVINEENFPGEWKE
jgi:Tfp pilus assembly protein PilE